MAAFGVGGVVDGVAQFMVEWLHPMSVFSGCWFRSRIRVILRFFMTGILKVF